MTDAGASLRPWLAAAVLFHALLAAAAWRVSVAVPAAAPAPVRLHLLPTLRSQPAGVTPVPEPAVNPGPIRRPYLQPPPVDVTAAALLPGPFPSDDPQVRARLARPVLPHPALPPAALLGVDPTPVQRREPPPPLLD